MYAGWTYLRCVYRARPSARVGSLKPVQDTLPALEQLGAPLIHALTHLAREPIQPRLIRGVGFDHKIIDGTETLISVEIRELDEIADGAAERLREQLGMETPQQLEIEIHLHIEIVKTVVAEIAVEKRVIGDLVEGLGSRICKAVVEAKIIAEQPTFGDKFGFQPGPRICLGAAEIEGVFNVPFDEAEIDQDLIESGLRLNISRL